MENFLIPFKNVHKVEISRIYLNNGLSSIGDMFPNLCSLSINSINYGNQNDLSAALHLPYLEHLNISLNHPDNRIEHLLNANHQLRSLEISISDSCELNKLLDMIYGMASISKFVMKLQYPKISNVIVNELLRLANEHPFLTEEQFERYLVTANDVIIFIGQLNTLEKFRFQVKDRSHYDRLMGQLGSDGEWKIEYQPDIIILSR